jgi:peptidoglycan/xylan/chitin deacetylase (PgdA/CDA1 family)
MQLRCTAFLLLVLLACGRTERPQGAAPQAVKPLPSVGAWSWHPLGGLAVVEGELSEATELVLEGRSIRERRFAEFGPVRWEFFRPPEGESAVLRTADGRELARFDFSLQKHAAKAPVDPPRVVPPQIQPTRVETARVELPRAEKRLTPAVVPEPLQPRPLPEPPAPRTVAEAQLRNLPVTSLSTRKPITAPSPLPEPEPPAPRTLAEARLKHLPLTPIPSRKPLDLPHASEAPGPVARRASLHTPVLVEPPAPRVVSPVPPPVAMVSPVIPLRGAPPAWPGMGEALNLTRGPAGQKRILLSFDGGSSSEVAVEVLDLLKARNVRTTLFLTGAFIQRYPALVKRMAAEGHELGNHTMNHPHFAPGMKRDSKWTRERIQRELLDADAALVRLLGRPMDPYWRAPYGEHTAEIRRWAEELGYRHVGWSEGADTLDWAGPKDRRLYRSGEAIVARLEKRLGRDGDGMIVLMHLGSARDLGDRPTEGLGAFMDRARKEGWTFVSVGTILRDLGKPVWDPHQRLALLNGSHAQGR